MEVNIQVRIEFDSISNYFLLRQFSLQYWTHLYNQETNTVMGQIQVYTSFQDASWLFEEEDHQKLESYVQVLVS